MGSEISSGRRARSVLLIVVGLAVLREGSETVLFLYGIAASGGGASGSMLLGGVVGIVAGGAAGALVYAGLLRIPLRWFFAATGVLVLFVAAGMASQAARLLIQADVLPSLATPLWDTSHLLPQTRVGHAAAQPRRLRGAAGGHAAGLLRLRARRDCSRHEVGPQEERAPARPPLNSGCRQGKQPDA